MADDNIRAPAATTEDNLLAAETFAKKNHKFMIYCRGRHCSIGKVKAVQNVMGMTRKISTYTPLIKN